MAITQMYRPSKYCKSFIALCLSLNIRKQEGYNEKSECRSQYCFLIHSPENLCFNNPGITIIFIFGLWFVKDHIELIYLAKIPMNEVTSEAATKHDAAITTNFMLLIDYCGYYYSGNKSISKFVRRSELIVDS